MSGFISRYTRLISGAAIIVVFSFASSALADQEVNSGIVNVPNAPIVITACKMSRPYSSSYDVRGPVVIGNRTKHALAHVQIVYAFYDNENVRMYQTTQQYSLAEPVLTGDTATLQGGAGLNGSPQLLSRVTCRVQAADFSGNKRWQYGQAWSEKLVPLTTEQTTTTSESGVGPSQAIRTQSPALPKITVAVANSWNDTVNGLTLIHDAIIITGGDTDTPVRGNNFVLTMSLANGAKKMIPGLTQQVPRYSKIDPRTGNNIMAYEVAPQEDLGALGTIVVPAHGTVRATVTFITNDALANPADNRAVTVQ